MLHTHYESQLRNLSARIDQPDILDGANLHPGRPNAGDGEPIVLPAADRVRSCQEVPVFDNEFE